MPAIAPPRDGVARGTLGNAPRAATRHARPDAAARCLHRRARAVSSAISTSTTSTPSGSSQERRWSRSTQTVRCVRARGSRDHGDVDVAVAVLRLSGGALAILSGHAPRPARLRRPARGLRHRRQHRRRSRRRAARSTRSSPALRRPAGAGYRDFMDRFEPAYRAELEAFVATVRSTARTPCSLARGTRGDAGRTGGRPLARRASAHRDRGDRSHLSHRRLRQPPATRQRRRAMGIEDEMHETIEEDGRALPPRPDRQGGTARGRPHGIRRAGRGLRGG